MASKATLATVKIVILFLLPEQWSWNYTSFTKPNIVLWGHVRSDSTFFHPDILRPVESGSSQYLFNTLWVCSLELLTNTCLNLFLGLFLDANYFVCLVYFFNCKYYACGAIPNGYKILSCTITWRRRALNYITIWLYRKYTLTMKWVSCCTSLHDRTCKAQPHKVEVDLICFNWPEYSGCKMRSTKFTHCVSSQT